MLNNHGAAGIAAWLMDRTSRPRAAAWRTTLLSLLATLLPLGVLTPALPGFVAARRRSA